MKQEYYLGIDIGGTSAKFARISASGELSDQGSFPTGSGQDLDGFLKELYRITDQAVEEGILGIGVCCLGIIQTGTGQILGGVENLPFLKGLSLKHLLEERYPDLPVSVANDVKAVARGEQWMGAAKGCSSFVCLTLGTGLGGALVLDSHVVEGSHFRAGEICYTDYNGENDYLEKHVSTKWVLEAAAKKVGLPELNGFDFFDLVRRGNPVCEGILNVWMDDISRVIANIIILLDVELVVIGGGISAERELILPRILSYVDRRLPPEMRDQTRIETAMCANRAGVLGAVVPLIFPQGL